MLANLDHLGCCPLEAALTSILDAPLPAQLQSLAVFAGTQWALRMRPGRAADALMAACLRATSTKASPQREVRSDIMPLALLPVYLFAVCSGVCGQSQLQGGPAM